MSQGEGSATHFQLLFTGVIGEDMEELQTLLLTARFDHLSTEERREYYTVEPRSFCGCVGGGCGGV
jgi:hypothetical protein